MFLNPPVIVAVIAGLFSLAIAFLPGVPTASQKAISYNQSGGITTTGDVNLNVHKPQPRKLSFSQATSLVKEFQSRDIEHKRLRVGYQAGDNEAYQFAKQVHDFLNSRGYSVDPYIAPQFYNPPVTSDLTITDDTKDNLGNTIWNIAIGSNVRR